MTNRFKKLTLTSLAVYIFVLALCVKAVFFYEAQHPPKEDLPSIQGIVKEIQLGGQGDATSLRVKSEQSTHRCSSFYGFKATHPFN